MGGSEPQRHEGAEKRLSGRRVMWRAFLAAYIVAAAAVTAIRRDPLAGAVLMGLVFFPAFLILLCVDNLIMVYARRTGGYVVSLGWVLLILMSLFSSWLWLNEWEVYVRSRESAYADQCRANVHQLAQAMRIYVEKNDDTFPPADKWCDAISPYVEDPKSFVCPERPRLKCGYAFNRALSGIRADNLENSGSLVVIFESDRGWNASGGKELLPREPRHYAATDTYGFANWHASRWSRRASDPEHQPEWEPMRAVLGKAK